MIKAIELRKGKTVLYNGELSVVHAVAHVEHGKGGSYMQTKIKDVKKGTIFDVRFRVDERLEVPFVESKEYEYLYKDGGMFIVMDLETYDQIPISAELVGDGANWLKPNEKVSCQVYDEEMISLTVPQVVELAVTSTPPAIKGATVTNQNKEAVLETGAKVRVPPFVEEGTVIRVDTRTGQYLERAK